jgi:peptide/nickel transport system substrate-binding protein
MTSYSLHVMTSLTRRRFLQGSIAGVAGLASWLQGRPRLAAAPAQRDEPRGQMTWAIHVTIAPTWFDPAEAVGLITPYMFFYAIHDALVKPMPGNLMTPSLATQWTESPDGFTYDFELRQGVTFHNGDPFSAEDVLFSFERYKGAGVGDLKRKVKAVEIVDAHHIRFRLHELWPDFMTFYGTPATGAGWIVPKKYLEKVGDEGFKNHPIGLGPYRFISHQPGLELVLEANTVYWRKTPYVKRLVMKSVPEPTTRLAMLKKQEADVTYGLYGALAENDFGDVEAIRLRLALYEELSNQNPTPFQWKFDRAKLTALLAKIEARQKALTETRFTCSKEAA